MRRPWSGWTEHRTTDYSATTFAYAAAMIDMQRNVGLLATCQALMMTANVLLFTTSALVGLRLAAHQGLPETLATLPLAVQFLATMLTIIPASLLMKRIGRREIGRAHV